MNPLLQPPSKTSGSPSEVSPARFPMLASPWARIISSNFSLTSHRPKTLSAYHSQRLAQAVEDMIGTDDVGQAMAVQIGLQGRLAVCEHQHNAVAGQVFV